RRHERLRPRGAERAREDGAVVLLDPREQVGALTPGRDAPQHREDDRVLDLALHERGPHGVEHRLPVFGAADAHQSMPPPAMRRTTGTTSSSLRARTYTAFARRHPSRSATTSDSSRCAYEARASASNVTSTGAPVSESISSRSPSQGGSRSSGARICTNRTSW